MREGGKDRDGGRQIRRKTDIEKNESSEGDRVCVRERDPFSCVSMQSGRVKKQMESDQRKKSCMEEQKKS